LYRYASSAKMLMLLGELGGNLGGFDGAEAEEDSEMEDEIVAAAAGAGGSGAGGSRLASPATGGGGRGGGGGGALYTSKSVTTHSACTRLPGFNP
jgi:hypothetical protein